MASLHIPAEIEAQVRALADDSHQDPNEVWAHVLAYGLAAAKDQALHHKLKLAHDEYLRGDYASAAEAIAALEEE